MSGGAYDYGFYKIEEYARGMKKYDPLVSELLEEISELCHDLEWYESGDYGEDTFEEKLGEFKTKWLVATPEVQERVKNSILNYCNEVEMFCDSLREGLKEK